MLTDRNERVTVLTNSRNYFFDSNSTQTICVTYIFLWMFLDITMRILLPKKYFVQLDIVDTPSIYFVPGQPLKLSTKDSDM